jgi:HAD superfamily hydrolase (TIGR01549 family)
MYKVVGFDLFGTLFSLDEAISKGKILKQTLDNHEYEVFDKEWLNWHRNTYSLEVFLDRIKEDLDSNLDEKKLELIKWRVTIEKPELYSDVLPTLKMLRKDNYPLVLLTNSPPTAKNLFRNEKDLSNLFSSTFWSFENSFMKPEPEAFDYMIRSADINKTEFLYVGDSYDEDYQGAKNLGIASLLLDRSGEYPLVAERITSLSEIKKYL